MEALISILVVVLSAGGLAVGLALLGRPLRTSCGGAACRSGGGCAGCPNRTDDDA